MDKLELIELGKILELTKGKKPIIQFDKANADSMPYVDIEAFETGRIKHYTDDKKCIPCDQGDVLIVCDGSRSGLVGRAIKGYVGSTLAKISAKGLSNDYLFHFLQGKYALLNTKIKGTGTPHLNTELLKKQKLIVPNIQEQQRIIVQIDELLSKLDKGVESLQIAKNHLTIYRQSVLKEAFKDYRDWTKYYFVDLMSVIRNGYGVKPDDKGAYKILRISAVRPMKLDLRDYRLNESMFSLEDTIHENDLLFTRYNGSKEYVGVCAAVPPLSCEYGYPDKIIKCTPKIQDSNHSKFLQYYLSQGEARKYLRSKVKTTSGQNGISGSDIKNTVVYLPDIKIQKLIVSQIEERFSVCDSIEQTINIAIQQAETMRQDILKQAFEGSWI